MLTSNHHNSRASLCESGAPSSSGQATCTFRGWLLDETFCRWAVRVARRLVIAVLESRIRTLSFRLYYTILYYTILYYTILYHTILYYTILHYTILYYTILYYTILYYTILLYTLLSILAGPSRCPTSRPDAAPIPRVQLRRARSIRYYILIY